jgi:hypothetical protein
MALLSPYQRARLLLTTAAVVCFCIFWWIGRFFDIPAHPGHEISLLQQPHAVVAIVITATAFVVCTALGTAVAGVIRFNAGLVAAGVGLMALSVRGGTSRDVLFYAMGTGAGAAIFLKLIVETAILGVAIGACALLLEWLYSSGTVRDRESALPPVPVTERSDFITFAVQLLATAVGVALIARTEDKQQVLAAVAIGSFAGSAAAHSIYPSAQRGWYWAAPLVVGIVGYLLAYMNPKGMEDGALTSSLATLARPLPLDYASLGVAGAVVGHWMGRRWHRDREDAAAAATNKPLPESARFPS